MRATAVKRRAAAAAIFLVSGSTWAQAQGVPEAYTYYGPHMMWGGSWFGMFLGALFFILMLVALIAGIAVVARWFGMTGHGPQPPHHAPPGSTPLDILKERFARGEIDKDEYEERRRVLGE